MRRPFQNQLMPPDKCPKCFKPKSTTDGSLTQWVNKCTCDQAGNAPASQSQARCKTCGKPVRDKQSGTLTQWVFQQDACSCDRPVVEYSASTKEYKQAAFRGFDDKGEVEIELESGKFPAERYKPVEVLGAGVSGTVYLSRDRVLGKRVAVKVLRVLDRDALLSFQNEARTTSKLSHPNIIKVLDFGSTDGGVPFMVMEFVPGTSLETLIKENGGLDFETALEVFIELADALEYAHKSHILHRDLKPSNILIVENDGHLSAHLIDFGVAKLQEHLQTSTIYNGTALVGTPAYMSPDQALGLKFDERSDIYSLGCIMFEALTAEQVFSAGSPLEIISLHAHEEPPNLLDYFEKTPTTEAMASIVERCLAKDPDLRYQNVGELKRALQAVPTEKAVGEQHPKGSELEEGANRVLHPRKVSRLPLLTILSIVLSIIVGVRYAFSVLMKPLVMPTIQKEEHILDAETESSKADFEMTTDVSSMRMPDVSNLSSTQTYLTDTSIKSFVRSNRRLEDLTIAGSVLSPTGLRELKDLPALTQLHLADIVLTREHFRALSEIRTLERISISTPDDQIDLVGLSALSNSNIIGLSITKVTITDQALRAIASIKSLRVLDFNRCLGFRKSKISNLVGLPRLSSLSLYHTDTTDETLQDLRLLRRVTSLDLSYTHVSDKVFKELDDTAIEKLNLIGCPKLKTRPKLRGVSIYFDPSSKRHGSNDSDYAEMMLEPNQL